MHTLSPDAERLAAGREDPSALGLGEDTGRERGDLRGDVLAVVGDEEDASTPVPRDDEILDTLPRGLADRERTRESERDAPTISRREVDPPNAVGERGSHVGRHFGRKPRLPGPGRADEREE
ncbi:MAG: hypothetical protein ACRDO9_05610, partial [Gaiellales bacterium]